MEKANFEKLEVYLLSEKLADRIWNIVCKWDYFAKDTIGKQVTRAADSIGANIAEGTGRGSFPDNLRFIRMARASLYETQHWLRRSYRRRLLSREEIETLRKFIAELGPRLNAYFRAVRTAATNEKRQKKTRSTKYKVQSTKFQSAT